MAKKSVLPNNVGKRTGHRESRPVWNNVQTINHQKKFAPTVVFTKSGRIPVSDAKPKAATSTSAAKPVNTAGPKQSANFSNSRSTFHKSHSPIRSGCSRHMTGNKAYLANYQEINDGGFVAFGSSRVTDDLSRFSWVFFLATKDETSKVLKPFITTIENQINKKVKVVRCDNGTKFKNKDLVEFCGMKGIKREYSNARTPQQNGVAKRKNKTLIEATRTMLADLLLPITFWAEAVNTACYVLNRTLVTKLHNKTHYKDENYAYYTCILCVFYFVLCRNGYCKNHEKRAKNRAITNTRMERVSKSQEKVNKSQALISSTKTKSVKTTKRTLIAKPFKKKP
nr:putative ribonuclease H-like domain-containing protein [Tanacetum cinerariifolium]